MPLWKSRAMKLTTQPARMMIPMTIQSTRLQRALCGGSGGLIGSCGVELLARSARIRFFLDMVGFFLDGFSRESDRGPGSLSGKREYSVLLLVRFVTRIGNGSGKLNQSMHGLVESGPSDEAL
jgi:hypothetical protein